MLWYLLEFRSSCPGATGETREANINILICRAIRLPRRQIFPGCQFSEPPSSCLVKYFAEAWGFLAHYTFVHLLYSFISSPSLWSAKYFSAFLPFVESHTTTKTRPTKWWDGGHWNLPPIGRRQKAQSLWPGRRLGVWHQIKHEGDERVRRANYDIAPRCQNISRSEGGKKLPNVQVRGGNWLSPGGFRCLNKIGLIYQERRRRRHEEKSRLGSGSSVSLPQQQRLTGRIPLPPLRFNLTLQQMVLILKDVISSYNYHLILLWSGGNSKSFQLLHLVQTRRVKQPSSWQRTSFRFNNL